MVDCHSFSVALDGVTLSPVKNVTAVEIKQKTFVLVAHVVAWMRYVIRAALHWANKKSREREEEEEKKTAGGKIRFAKQKAASMERNKKKQKNFQIN